MSQSWISWKFWISRNNWGYSNSNILKIVNIQKIFGILNLNFWISLRILKYPGPPPNVTKMYILKILNIQKSTVWSTVYWARISISLWIFRKLQARPFRFVSVNNSVSCLSLAWSLSYLEKGNKERDSQRGATEDTAEHTSPKATSSKKKDTTIFFRLPDHTVAGVEH